MPCSKSRATRSSPSMGPRCGNPSSQVRFRLWSLVLRMELADGCVVEFMAADFEVPLFAVERVCGIVIKPTDGFDEWGGAVHGGVKVDWSLACDARPAFVQRPLVEKHNFELLDFIFFDVALRGCAAGQEHDGQSGKGWNALSPAGWSSRSGLLCRGGVHYSD